MNCLDQIEAIRARNNKNWMAILKLAFKLSPKKTKMIMNDIADNDGKIHELMRKLTE